MQANICTAKRINGCTFLTDKGPRANEQVQQ